MLNYWCGQILAQGFGVSGGMKWPQPARRRREEVNDRGEGSTALRLGVREHVGALPKRGALARRLAGGFGRARWRGTRQFTQATNPPAF